MLAPKKVKHRKSRRTDQIKGRATRMTDVSFGQYGMKSLQASWITARQIEAARRVMTRFVARGGRIWIRIFPDKSITMKGNEMPMGKGKGAVDHYVAVVKPGTVMFEMSGIDEATAREAMHLAGYKLPVKTQFISR
ncbi:MAG: 50S ribosomal protein L16 [Candidatus Komeilibacteria bacterium RIFCSPLOWO2_01_FULL_53_11]|uniref:Large ribosomal subunit protein uL16 n=1 Tax=Candidatus Komeilibacteria bacterium RIFCSPLOWO2_01_FULL_53_11 TaxID=1798552 RepID=A0A1G2BWS3_9BACT|nr:MAG: 50S ribosomal protein L16 [Candidatus Komeilibacteria bacterium RIFCSPLOWO2_01_FULL_53_11]